jgi:hypothetical protein
VVFAATIAIIVVAPLEGHDLRALRRAVQVLKSAEHPLVIFPEGEVFHLAEAAG